MRQDPRPNDELDCCPFSANVRESRSFCFAFLSLTHYLERLSVEICFAITDSLLPMFWISETGADLFWCSSFLSWLAPNFSHRLNTNRVLQNCIDFKEFAEDEKTFPTCFSLQTQTLSHWLQPLPDVWQVKNLSEHLPLRFASSLLSGEMVSQTCHTLLCCPAIGNYSDPDR